MSVLSPWSGDSADGTALRGAAAALAGATGPASETLGNVATLLTACYRAEQVEIWQREPAGLRLTATGKLDIAAPAAPNTVSPRTVSPSDRPRWFEALDAGEATCIQDDVAGTTTLVVPTIPDSNSATGLLVIKRSAGPKPSEAELAAPLHIGEFIAIYMQRVNRLTAAINSSPTAVTIRCESGFLLDCNEAFLRFVNRPRNDVIGSSLVEVVDLAEAHRRGVDWGGSDEDSLDIPYLCADGRTVWGRTSTVRTSDGSERLTISHIHDITDSRIEELRLNYEATHDELTGLMNRRALMTSLGESLESTKPVTLVLLDLDGFKVTNDSLGHNVGDQLLRVVAQRLLRVVRPQDVVARLGGDEFVLVLQRADSDIGTEVAARILEVLRQPARLGGTDVFTGASIGVATTDPDETQQPDTLLREADIAMYAAKAQGKNCFEVFNSSHRTAVSARRVIETDLRRAVRSQALEVYYQPILDLESGSLRGAEALVRWRGAGDALIDATKFPEVAREIGVLAELGEAALEAACLAGIHWATDKHPGEFTLRVNLPLAQLSSRGLVPLVNRVLECTQFPAQNLCLEISESALMSDPDRVADSLNALHDLGVKLCVDSFGQGLGSILQLRRFPIDTLKIAPEIVWGVDEDPDYLSIAEMIMLLANSMNLDVVADGIETDAQRAAMHALGVRQGQGYYLHRPVPAAELTELMRLYGTKTPVDIEAPTDSLELDTFQALDLRDKHLTR